MSESDQATIRKQALLARRALTSEQRHIASSRIASDVVRSSCFYRARRIGIYLPTDNEVDTSEIIQRSWRAKKKIFTPVIDGFGTIEFCELRPTTQLRPNRFNILEPVDGHAIASRTLDVVFVPLSAFDADGNRIGMGGGFYDRCFSFQKNTQSWRKPKLIGLAFNCQKVSRIIRNPWDISLCEVFSH